MIYGRGRGLARERRKYKGHYLIYDLLPHGRPLERLVLIEAAIKLLAPPRLRDIRESKPPDFQTFCNNRRDLRRIIWMY